MNTFSQLFVGGIGLGAMYGLIALGFVIIFKATHILNFAHAAFLVIGAYVIARLSFVNFFVAAAAAIAGVVLLALGVERFLLRRVAGRSAIAVSIMTIGLEIILITGARTQIGTQILPLGDPWGNSLLTVGGVVIPLSRILAITVGAAVVAVLFVWLKRSAWGIAFRAATELREVAPLMGIPLNRLAAMSWAIAGTLAVIAGVFLSTFPAPGVNMDLAPVTFRAFPAAMIGGLDSLHGAIVGGLVIGVAEVLAQGYQNHIPFLPSGSHGIIAWVVMLAVLMIKPAGIFGSQAVRRA